MRTVTTIDVSKLPDLLRLAEEVWETKKPRLLKRADETLAMVMPVASKEKKQAKRKDALSKEDFEAFLSAAGSWKGLVDGEQLKRDIYAVRASHRPPVEL